MSRSRADQILAAFTKFHEENPRVWELFVRFTMEAIRGGHAHYSSDAILHRIRWHTEVETVGGHGVKINNNFTAYYARLFHWRYPQHAGFFRNRKQVSEGMHAYERDMQVFMGEEE